MGVIVKIKKPLLADVVKADLELNKEIVRKLTEFWASMGHIIKFEIVLVPEMNIHRIISDDLKNGLPCNESLSPIARKTLTKLSRY